MKPKKVCPVCGEPVTSTHEKALYCSRKCARKAHTIKTAPTDCPHGPWLRCRERNCETCGFYPPVTAARKKALEERYGTG